MVNQTPNHGIDDYEKGVDSSWDHSDLVQLCEDRLVLFNSIDGNKSNFTPHSGAFFIDDAVSPTEIYLGNGSSWNSLGNYAGSGGGPYDGTAEFQHGAENASLGIVDRPLLGSAGTKTIYVAPDSGAGSTNGDGSQSNPYNLETALEELPMHPSGEIVVDLYTVPNNNGNIPARYAGAWISFRPPVMVGHVASSGIYFRGNTAAPSDVQLDKVFNWGGWYGKGEQGIIEGIQFNETTQLQGEVLIRDCNLYNRENERPDNAACVATKSGSVRIRSCTIGEGNNDNLIRSAGNGRFFIELTDINGLVPEIDTKGEVVIGSSVTITRTGTGSLNLSASEAAELIQGSPAGGRLIAEEHMVVRSSSDGRVFTAGTTVID